MIQNQPNSISNFNQTKWLITGGTSGLGLALAQLAAAHGAEVAIVARQQERLAKISAQFGFIPIHADVSDKKQINAIAAQAITRLGGIDFLVNNASTLGPTPLRLLLDTECESFEEALQTNLLGPFRLTKAILPAMRLKGGGTVVNISSDAAVSAYAQWGAYGASKAALDHLSHIWSEELKGSGIRFLSIDPGDMNTPLHAAALPDSDPATLKDPRQSAEQLLHSLTELKTDLWERRAL